MRMNTALLVSAAAWLLGACGHFDYPFVQIEGRHFSIDALDSIVDGVTSEEEVLSAFGVPFEQQDSPSSRTLRYYSVRRRENVEKGLLTTRRYFQTVTQELRFIVVSGVVVQHRYETNTKEDSVKE